MKKTLSLVMVIVMLSSIVITGCSSTGQDAPDDKGSGGTSAVTSSDDTKVLKIGSMFNNPDPANQGGWDISQYKGMKALGGAWMDCIHSRSYCIPTGRRNGDFLYR